MVDSCNLKPDCGEKGEYRASDHEREVIRCSEPCGGGKPPENEEKPHENADEARDNRNNMNTFDNFMFLLRTSGYLNNLPNAAGRLRIDVDQSGRSECPLRDQNAKTSQ